MRVFKLNQEQQIFYNIRLGKTKKVIKYLEEEEENPNKIRWSGWSLLHRAAEQGQTETCEALLVGGANVNSRTTMGWFTPLHCALGNGWIDTAEFLVECGASLYTLSKEKLNPVNYGIKRGYKELNLQFQDRMVRLETVKIMKAKQAEDKRLADEKAKREEFELQSQIGPTIDQEEMSQLFAQHDMIDGDAYENESSNVDSSNVSNTEERGNVKMKKSKGNRSTSTTGSRGGSRGNSKSPSRRGSVDSSTSKSPSRSPSRSGSVSSSRTSSRQATKSKK